MYSVQSYSSLYACASFIPPKCVDQRKPEEQVERTVLSQHSTRPKMCITKPLDIQVPNIYIYIYIYIREKQGAVKVRKYHKG